MTQPLHLFEGFGIELEYMIVHDETLSVLPISDEILHTVAGEYVSEIEIGDLRWSNEMVLHVIELKTNGPAPSLEELPQKFNEHITYINNLLKLMGGRLMPSAMHPWMNPAYEMKLWPHEYNPVYETFNKIFGCQGHGWSNLQSIHINLPFADDKEFARLHAAIRLLLPILPALAASSPIVEGQLTGLLDNRLDVYRTNARQVPSVTGRIIPEPVFTRHDYENQILQRMYRDIAPYDPAGILQHEWLNARGAIARFDRNTIEIRVLDIQECPLADLAISAVIVAVLKALIAERWINFTSQQSWPVKPLEAILLATITHGELAIITNNLYLEAFEFPSPRKCTAGELWQHLVETLLATTIEANDPSSLPFWVDPLRIILQQGSLSRRIIRSIGTETSLERIKTVYRELSNCLAEGKMFLPKI